MTSGRLRGLAKFGLASVVLLAGPSASGLLDRPSGDGGSARAQGAASLSPFQCYSVRATRGFAPFLPVSGLDIVDRFGASSVDLRRTSRLCAPASVEGSPASVPSEAEHLESYTAKRSSGAERFARVERLRIVDEFGPLLVDVLKPSSFLVPTTASETAPPAAPTPETDHLTCYKIRVSKGTPRFRPLRGAIVEDGFGPLAVDVRKPTLFCAPTNPENEAPGAESHAAHLTCYKARARSVFAPRTGVHAHNGFGPETLDLLGVSDVCLPSIVDPLVEPTPTPTGGNTPTPTPTLTPTPSPTPTPTPTATPTPSPSPTPSPTPTPGFTPPPSEFSRTCAIGGPNSWIALQFRDTPLGDLRIQGSLSGSQDFAFSAVDPSTGARSVHVPASAIHFDPVVLPVPVVQPVRVCITPTGPDGSGTIDCDGGSSEVDITVRQDHRTNAAPGAGGGLPQDPECADTRTLPDGSVSQACLESTGGTCNIRNTHVGTCSSPLEYSSGGTFAAGDVRLAEYLTIRQVSNIGPDNQQCTGDDTYGPPAALRTFFTTGTARATLYDANSVAGATLDQGAVGCETCATEVSGAGRSCELIDGVDGDLTGLMVAGAFAVLDLDSLVGDAVVTIQAECQ